MIIAVSSQGPNLESMVDPRFGRAACFIIYDTETDQFEAVDNQQNLQAAQGAGVQSAQRVAGLKVELAISGNYGPKAFSLLHQAGIKTAQLAGGTVAEAIEKAKNNQLTILDNASVDSHWM